MTTAKRQLWPLPSRFGRVGQLIIQGKLPRSWRSGGRPANITLPRAPRPMAEMLVRRLGVERAAELARALSDMLSEAAAGVSGIGRR